MNVLEWILNSVSSIASLWDRSPNELLSEHRAYERRILVYTVAALILIIAAMLIIPSIEIQPTDGMKYATNLLYKYIGVGALLLGTYSSIASLWNIAVLVYFRYKNEISN